MFILEEPSVGMVSNVFHAESVQLINTVRSVVRDELSVGSGKIAKVFLGFCR